MEQLEQRCTAADPMQRPTAWQVLCLLQEQAQHSVTLADTPRERLELFSVHPGSSSTTGSTSSSYTSTSNSDPRIYNDDGARASGGDSSREHVETSGARETEPSGMHDSIDTGAAGGHVKRKRKHEKKKAKRKKRRRS